MGIPLIFITIGDPAGIGPEVTIKSLNDIGYRDDYNTVVIGSADILSKTMQTCGIDLKIKPIKSIEEVNDDHKYINLLDLNNTPA